ncbi:conjugal transfer protein [Citrobacter amalonaticus]|uniref:Conjugal transfer protein n=1 Tax=Citrobacter amalonaticus TaxID=35703 RepID=A0A2S4RTT2_CITAM|nr:conjugal transfer protein TraF [Citrobacter amalonaticus]POT57147.1 conjugal transfer protein [Citrobacter amalonaticus]POT72564.1 conjugal transfer protein [Citrobacter amalonaticus]POU63419.1 conjugal transfer protein [Citrobacter amalonaticus]POV03183.1 conjugal transfer protein [Citrobacter amalonaticus]
MKQTLKFSVVSVVVSFIMANQAEAANTWTEARNDAMGGTGVASANYGSGVLINPALLAKSQPDDEITVIFPALGGQISDKDNLRDKIDDITDDINSYRHSLDNINPFNLFIPGSQGYQQVSSAAGNLADRLESLKGKTATAKAGGGLAVSIPNDVLAVAFVAKANARARVSSYIDQGDINTLRGVEAVPSGVLAVDPQDLKSKGFGRAAIVSDYGVAIARQFNLGGVPISVGVTPKLQQTWLYNYTVSIYNFNSDDINSSRYRNDDTGFNVDAGLAADFGENWTVGLSGQNVFSRDIDTKEVDGVRDTYQIRPLVTAGAAWHNDFVTLSVDGDLTETKGFKSEDNSQYVGVGAEVRPLDWLAVRAGYRADVKDNDSNVFTGGVGFAPFNRVHVDLMGLYGEDETWGAGAQLSVTF